FDRPGITGAIIEWQDLSDTKLPADKRKPFEREGLRIKVEVGADTVPGIYGFRILTKGSLSALAHLLVASGGCVNEAEPNNVEAEAQVLQPRMTVNGRLDDDADVDLYRFEAKAGDRIAFLVHAARLQRPVPQLERDFSDILVSLHDAAGAELASADDSLTEDPEFAYSFQQSGTYYLRLREARYHTGRDKWWYALSAVAGPVVRSVFPPVVRPGQKVTLSFEGFNLEGAQGVAVEVPTDAKESFEFQLASNRLELGITGLAAGIEVDSAGPREILIPAGVNGRILTDGETDRYRFPAKAGERFEFEVQARRWGSSLDALIEIRDVSGRLLEAQDDMVNTSGQTVDGLAFPVNKDPRIEWTAPSDGQYEVHVRDANHFGGRQRFYFFAARRAREDFALVLDDDRMPIGPGESVTALVAVERRNGFRGPVRLFVRGLPDGVFAHESVIPAHLNQANIVLTARPEARPGANPILVGGRAITNSSEGHSLEIERIATPFAPMGQAGGRSFLKVPTAVASVSEGSDIILEADPKVISLERGKSVTVKIRAVRNKYSGPIEMNVILWNLMQRFSKLPDGLIYEEKLSKTSLGPNETEGYVTFRAEPDAPLLDDYLMTVMGQITYNRIYMTRVAAPLRLTIR
ncbi:MAG TPA: PPC domain-containing protein, partial [Bryobacteraceae bacterium]|nr:PPC domain-containing protein [Bryobacteraceae bacterium]